MKGNRIIIILSVLCCLFRYQVIGQSNATERVYLHLSSQELIAGETLYYSAYCVADGSQLPSLLSQVLYVEVIGEKGVVHQEKIMLDKGRGQGDFFVSTLYETGNYKVIAYTRWMRNVNTYFEAQLVIINPFEEYEMSLDSSETNSMKIDFVSRSGKIVAGVPNQVSYKWFGDDNIDSKSPKLKIIDTSGELLVESQTDQYGVGNFEWTPEANTTYKVLLEKSNGKLAFFESPKVESSGTVIYVTSESSYYQIIIHSQPERQKMVTLEIWKADSLLLSKKAASNQTHLIPKQTIAEQWVTMKVWDEQHQLLAQREIVSMTEYKESIGAALPKKYESRNIVKLDVDLMPGNYSVSVRRKSEILSQPMTHAVLSKWQKTNQKYLVNPEVYLSTVRSFTQELIPRYPIKTINDSSSFKYLPEFRDEFVVGSLRYENGLPAPDKLMTLSILGENPQTRMTKTNEKGVFSLPFQSSIVEMDAYVSYMELDSNYQLSIENPFIGERLKFQFPSLRLDSLQIVQIANRSIRTQIENAYFDFRPTDSTYAISSALPLIPYSYDYVLDDYIRFRTIKETFIEFVTAANVRDNRKNKIEVVLPEIYDSYSYAPLMLLNGIPVADEAMLAFSPYKIEKISVLNKRFFLGAFVADGVISFTTKENQLEAFNFGPQYLPFKIKGLSQNKKYFFPTYENGKFSSQPDLRELLYWKPDLNITSDETQDIVFFTSDVTGTFLISIEGFTFDGQAISIVDSIQVSNPSIANK